MRLVLASNNPKKLAELQALLSPVGAELIAQSAFGLTEADEPHRTFLENALAKARHAARQTGLPALADDSGLCVDALGGAPGVDSAHAASLDAASSNPASLDAALPNPRSLDAAWPAIASPDREQRRARQDAANNAWLLQRLAGATDRRARFVATWVALRSADDPEPLVAVGRWSGEILTAPRGHGGFGYDPLLYIAALGATVAELDAAAKNAHSHRALAAAAMGRLLREAWRLG